VYNRPHKRTRATTANHDFLQRALVRLRQAGRNHEPLGSLSFSYKGRPYTAFELIASHPMLGVNTSAVAMLADRGPHGSSSAMDVVQGYREQVLLELGQDLRAGRFRPKEPRRIMVPKLVFSDDIGLESLRARWRADGGPEQKPERRPLVIDDPRLRVVCSSAAMVIGAYLDSRWPNAVVGCRPGVSIPRVLASIEAAARSTGRTLVVAADARGFFDNVHFDKCRALLRHRLGLREGDSLDRLLDLCLQFRPEKCGVPQGNPLSPLMANLYGVQALDRVGLSWDRTPGTSMTCCCSSRASRRPTGR